MGFERGCICKYGNSIEIYGNIWDEYWICIIHVNIWMRLDRLCHCCQLEVICGVFWSDEVKASQFWVQHFTKAP